MKNPLIVSTTQLMDNPEALRLNSYRLEHSKWKKWGTYLSERAWGTVREDYSLEGNTWNAFSYEEAASRTYRWNEDGLGGFCDRYQRLCFALTLWNGQDPLLKERLFGLTNTEGNHGEDVKEYYFYLDNTPTHSYCKMLYKYPQRAFPYEDLRQTAKKRTREEGEYELLDTGIFKENRYFDVFIEYAKASEEDILIRFTIQNRGPQRASCALLPTLWFRNTWSWGYGEAGPMGDEKGKPSLKEKAPGLLEANHPVEGAYFLYCQEASELLFTENETGAKDAFHRHLIKNQKCTAKTGTKAAFLKKVDIDSNHSFTLNLRFSKEPQKAPWKDFDALFSKRKQEAELFYAAIQKSTLTDELKMVQRQAFAGLLWSKQFYYFDLEQWLGGDPNYLAKRQSPRNSSWEHMSCFDLFSVPDKWEYPYFCGWDTAFHCVPMSLVDSDFAKRQIELLTREWYLHPNGQMPAYEWNFSDVNPPMLAWSAWRTYKIDAKLYNKSDRDFLKGTFNKLLLNFTWWVNQKDKEGNNVFQGGFLGLDNISIFDRSAPLPTGGYIDQTDGTAWMAFFCVIMMRIATHLSLEEGVYQDIATKFFEHFLRIAHAMTNCGKKGHKLWDDKDGFFYDALHLPDHSIVPLKVRSLVGLLPLLAVETLDPEEMQKLPTLTRRMEWFIKKHPETQYNIKCVHKPGQGDRRLLAILTEERLVSILKYMLDEKEFLSPHGIRSLSKYHQDHPYHLMADGKQHTVRYVPAESDSGLFGGNSNWRGPIWFPINFLLIESLQKFYHYYGDELKVEFPTGSGHYLNLWDVAAELSKRLIGLFQKDLQGKRPCFGNLKPLQKDPYWQDLILFNEYFHGENGVGLGASHQTGWTALVAKLIQQTG